MTVQWVIFGTSATLKGLFRTTTNYMRHSPTSFPSSFCFKLYFQSRICTHVNYYGVAMTTGFCINTLQLSVKDSYREFNGGHCLVRMVSQKGNRGRKTVWLHLAEHKLHMKHQRQAKRWQDILSIPFSGGKQTNVWVFFPWVFFFHEIDICCKLQLNT